MQRNSRVKKEQGARSKERKRKKENGKEARKGKKQQKSQEDGWDSSSQLSLATLAFVVVCFKL